MRRPLIGSFGLCKLSFHNSRVVLAGGGHFGFSVIWHICMEAGEQAFVGDNLKLIVYLKLSENLENLSQMYR